MTACPDRVLLLQGLLDGELDAANALDCEAHLKTCPACHAEFQRMQAVRDAATADGSAYRAPPSLHAQIEASLQAATLAAPPVHRQRVSPPPWAVGGVGAAIAASALLVIAPQLTTSGVENQLVASHVRSLLANHLIDIATSDQHVVRPWFNGKVDFAPPAPELKDQGFPLVGGRLDYIDGQVVPAIVYRRRLHTVNLFVWPQGAHGRPRTRTVRRDGYSLVEWSQGGLSFSAVSDVEAPELEQFRKVFSDNAPK